MSRVDPTQFKRLQAKWKKKLKESGFKDIENDHGDFTDHGSAHDLRQRKIGFRAGYMEAIRDYYMWAEDMANHGRFKSAVDRKIWKMHSDGSTSREIAAAVPYDNTWISRKIKKIRAYLRLQQRKEDIQPIVTGQKGAA